MLLGAFIGWFFTIYFDSLLFGLIVTMLAGTVTGIIFWMLIDIFRIAQHIAGLGIGFLCFGLSYTLFRVIPFEIRDTYIMLGFSKIYYIIGALIILSIFSIILFNKRLRFMYILNLIGENIRSSDLLGLNYRLIRLISSVLGVTLIFIGGFLTSCIFMQNFSMGIISGDGWIALCLVILSRWNVFWVFFGTTRL